MQDISYIALSASERALIQEALSAAAHHLNGRLLEIRLLSERLARADREYPDITVGVYGGLVQWVIGNPFPIRICDYDGEEDELPDLDARGQSCNTWLEPPSL